MMNEDTKGQGMVKRGYLKLDEIEAQSERQDFTVDRSRGFCTCL